MNAKRLLTAALLLWIAGGTAAATILNVPETTQEQNMWCWAGASRATLLYYGLDVAQCTIAEYTRTHAVWHNYGSVDCCVDPNAGCNYINYPTGAGSVEDILRHWGVDNNFVPTALSPTQASDEIEARRPFIIVWIYDTGGGHYVVGHGLEGSTLYYMDPWFGEGSKLAEYHWIVRGEDHTWVNTNTMVSSPAAGDLYFPRFSYMPGSWTEGFGFVNRGWTASVVQFTAYGADGSVLATSPSYPWRGKEQGAYQGEGLFGLSQAADAWIQATANDTSNLLGFFLTQRFDGGLRGLDGAAVFNQSLPTGVFPRVRMLGSWSTELFLCNPGDASVQVTVTGYNGTNSVAGSAQNIPAHGFVKVNAASLFASAFDGAIRLDCTGGIIGNALLKTGDDDVSSLNLQSIGSGGMLYAPHIVRMNGLYYTEVDLFNPEDSVVTATVSAYLADGSPMSEPFQVLIPAHQVSMLAGVTLGLPPGQDAEGWLKVDATGHDLVGCLTFGNPVDNHYVSTLPLQGKPVSEQYFAQSASGNIGGVNFFTGLAVVNPNAGPVSITISVYGSDGALYGTSTLLLGANSKYVRLLPQIEGIGTLPSHSSGYIRVIASKPVFAFVLFGDDALDFLSAVPAQY
jgi:hypothetical protein